MASVTACFSSPHCTSATKVLATQPMHHDSGATHSNNKPFALTCVCATRMGSQTGNLQHPFVFISRGAPQCTATAQMVSSTCIQQAKQACSIYQFYNHDNILPVSSKTKPASGQGCCCPAAARLHSCRHNMALDAHAETAASQKCCTKAPYKNRYECKKRPQNAALPYQTKMQRAPNWPMVWWCLHTLAAA